MMQPQQIIQLFDPHIHIIEFSFNYSMIEFQSHIWIGTKNFSNGTSEIDPDYDQNSSKLWQDMICLNFIITKRLTLA